MQYIVTTWPLRLRLGHGYPGARRSGVSESSIIRLEHGDEPTGLGTVHGLDVLVNAGAQLILGHRAERVDAAVAAFQLSEADRTELLAAGKGEGLFIARGDRQYIKVIASPEEHRLATTRPDEVAAIEAAARAGHDAPAA
jgi:hypothetical protein